MILWVNLTDAGPDSHGVELIPTPHDVGLMNGEQGDKGYILDERFLDKNIASYQK